jgi:hypothetical protein
LVAAAAAWIHPTPNDNECTAFENHIKNREKKREERESQVCLLVISISVHVFNYTRILEMAAAEAAAAV